MKRKWWLYIGFFALLLTGFYLLLPKEMLSKPALPVIDTHMLPFSFTNQNGKSITDKTVDGKVYVAEFFFTTCKGYCPRMNANMRRVFDAYKDEKDFMILSHTSMPETDSVPLLKAYEARMINGKLVTIADHSYKIEYDTSEAFQKPVINPNWNFVTGNKADLYKMARQSYIIDNNKPDSTQNISNQFIHSQFFALVDKYHRVRGVYDGLHEEEIQKLLSDIQNLLKEKVAPQRFMNGFSNNPN